MDLIFEFFVDEEEELDRQYDIQVQKRLLRNNLDPFSLPNKEFVKLFRLNKEGFQNLLIQLGPHLSEGQRSTKLSMETRVLAALRFFATGSYQRGVGEEYNIAVSQQSMSNIIAEVSTAIENIADRWIRFPINENQQQQVKLGFMEKFGFPGILGVIDGTHVAILEPTEDEHLYFNRKRFHSKNVQVICDSNLEILNVNANFGGAAHDSFIWRNSEVSRYLEENYDQNNRSWLIGDSGYPLQPWLMTPIVNTREGTPERRYDNALKVARNTVERCIGVLKMRFRCLTKERVMRYAPYKAGVIIAACCVLHNMCIRGNVELEEENFNEDEINAGPAYNNFFQYNVIQEGQRQRQNLINTYFA